MIKRIALLLSLVLINALLIGQSRWENIYDFPNTRMDVMDVIETYDRGILLLGGEKDDMNTWLVKCDINGEILWTKTIGNIDSNFTATSVIENFDGGVIMAGIFWLDTDHHGLLLMRIDSCGNKIWCNYIETSTFQSSSYTDVILGPHNTIIVLGRLSLFEQIEQVFLFCFSQEGENLWIKPYATKVNHPEIGFATGRDLYNYNNSFFISGHCYVPYPTNPGVYYLRPMFIKVDSMFNEEWVLPFGVNDSIVGLSWGILPLSDSTYMAHGKCYVVDDSSSTDKRLDTRALIMRFDENGNNTGYAIIPNEAISPPTWYNGITDAEQLTDTTFVAMATFGPEEQGNPFGEYIFDLEGNIYYYNSRPNTCGAGHVLKTTLGDYLFGTSFCEGSNYDMYLYKLDSNLQSVSYDTLPRNYDTLCPYPINSGYISPGNCMITTDIENAPTPQEYYAGLQSIPITPYPNPAKGKITFALENTQRHKNITLQCYNIFGSLLEEQQIIPGQQEAGCDVSKWESGMYVVVVRSDGKI